MKNKCLIILGLLFFIRSEAQTWNCVWSDEFNGETINTENWTYEIGGTGWGNNELQYYTNRPENAKTENGNLLVIARKESYLGKNYTSARLKTKDLFSLTYGKIEARIKLPVGKGLWPAFWMLGQNISQVGWPQCGEMDIMEHINNDAKVYGTMHWDNHGHVQYGKDAPCDVTTYHVYSVEWDAHSIKWFLDGNRYLEGTIENNVNSTEEFHLPFFLILNFAVGGNWPGNPDATTPFPDTLYVDYVRAYQVDTGIGENRHPVPTRTLLEYNYPNPFNAVTSISFRLPSELYASLKVFDCMGREVTTLASEKLQAGNHSRKWNAEGVPSGVYFCCLQTTNHIETKKLILLR